MIKGTYDPVKEPLPVPDIPSLFPDSIYRVCNAPPNSLCTVNHIAAGVIHIFPWSPCLSATPSGGQSPVTYGLLSKVPSPKETRDRTKQAMEKKRNGGVGKDGASAKEGEVKEEEAMVVRVVCHDTEVLAGSKKCQSKKEIHSGRVWVSSMCNRGTYHTFIHIILRRITFSYFLHIIIILHMSLHIC